MPFTPINSGLFRKKAGQNVKASFHEQNNWYLAFFEGSDYESVSKNSENNMADTRWWTCMFKKAGKIRLQLEPGSSMAHITDPSPELLKIIIRIQYGA